MPGMQALFEETDRLMRTPEGRAKLADDIEREANRTEERALHPRHPLPPAVVAGTLKSVESSRAHARELRAITGSKGLFK